MLIFQDLTKNSTQRAIRLVEILNVKLSLKQDPQKVYWETLGLQGVETKQKRQSTGRWINIHA